MGFKKDLVFSAITFIIHVSSIATKNNVGEKCGQASKLYSRSNEPDLKQPLNSGDLPWHAAVYDISQNNTLICGASIISHHVLVSAAHCFYDRVHGRRRNAGDYVVEVGELDNKLDLNRKEAHIFDVEQIIFKSYEDEKLRFQNDIVLLVTKRRLEFSKNISPICLNSTVSVTKYDLLDIPGFDVNLNRSTQYLTVARLPHAEYKTCSERAPETIQSILMPNEFCIGGGSINLLRRGLSGGGLVTYDPFSKSFRLVGILGIKLKDVPYLAITAYIPSFYFWIKTHVTEVDQMKKSPLVRKTNSYSPKQN